MGNTLSMCACLRTQSGRLEVGIVTLLDTPDVISSWQPCCKLERGQPLERVVYWAVCYRRALSSHLQTGTTSNACIRNSCDSADLLWPRCVRAQPGPACLSNEQFS